MQVGDPFTEKLLIEACLEMMEQDAIVGDPGHGRRGPDFFLCRDGRQGRARHRARLDRVPVRESGMTPYEIMLSESQERMLMILRPGSEAEARNIFGKWELDFAVIGRVTDTGRLVLRSAGSSACAPGFRSA